jgi:hypothetical protein
MSPAMQFPGPRDGLDEGSLAELATDCREIEIGTGEAPAAAVEGVHRPSFASTAGPIDVPEQAPALIDGLAAYGPCS